MNEATNNIMIEKFQIEQKTIDLIDRAEKSLTGVFKNLNETMAYNQYKVLSAFQECRISDMHFAWNTGYGYDDPGRSALERLYSKIFNTEAALVRPTIVNGTHALASVYLGILRPGDELMYCSGKPYDTMEAIIGLRETGQGSLRDYGITYKQIELNENGDLDIPVIVEAISDKTRIVSVQRATGYSFRKPISLDQIRNWVTACKKRKPDIICMTDNCYGEFTQMFEPTDVGVDIMAGSLIKNPGGGLALSGGYITGKENLVELASYRVTSPGIGAECGLTFGQTRNMFQGMFIAPQTVNNALKGAALCAKVFESLGYKVCPGPEDQRNDIIEAIQLGTPEAVNAFCEGIQAAAPIDSHVKPIAWDMPGYGDLVIMAAGAFVQGSSIELSADAPMREPYIAYFQGGLTYEHSKFGVINAVQTLINNGHIKY